jgi:Na+-driven multidrug efflux pump
LNNTRTIKKSYLQNNSTVNFSKYTQEFSYNLRLAYPIILGMLGHTIVGIVDNIYEADRSNRIGSCFVRK